MKVWKDGAGWHCEHAPEADFRSEAEARAAAQLSRAEALTASYAASTLARGDRLHELVVHWKCVHSYPYTPDERAWLDARMAMRAR